MNVVLEASLALPTRDTGCRLPALSSAAGQPKRGQDCRFLDENLSFLSL